MRTLGVIAILVSSATAGVVDRVAVVVGKNVITETEVLGEVRLTEFLNRQPLDLGPEQRRTAAERLVDQQLIRNEMELGRYPQPPESDADAMFRKECARFGGEGACRAALSKYGLTEAQLKKHLLWELAVMRFTDMRFSMGLPAPAGEPSAQPAPGTISSASRAAPEPGTNEAANRATPGNTSSSANRSAPGAEAAAVGGNVDQQLEAWLKEARSQTRVQFKKDAFQ